VGGTCGTHGRCEENVQDFGWELLRKDPLERPRNGWEDEIRTDLSRLSGVVQSLSNWLRVRTGGGLLYIR
jgi:hypothetical protein